jgi:hypothetical protein
VSSGASTQAALKAAIDAEGTAKGWGSGGTGAGLPATVVNKTGAYTAAAGDFVQGDTTSAGFTVTLPAAPAVGALVAVKKVDASANTLTIVPAGGGTIDGDPTATTTTKMAGAIFEHVGANVWRIVASMTTGGPQGPAGPTGPQGPQGIQGPTGTNGQGVPTGGTTGQVLAKTSNTDYATGWTTPSAGGGGGSPQAAMDAGVIGQWYAGQRSYGGSSNTTRTLALGTLLVGLPLVAQEAITIDQIGCYVQTLASGGLARVGVYQVNNQAKPYNLALNSAFATLLVDGGTVDASTVGPKSLTLGSPLVIAAGTAFVVAVAWQGTAAPGLYCEANNVWSSAWGSTNVLNGSILAVTAPGVTSALPATFTPTAYNIASVGGAGWYHRSA